MEFLGGVWRQCGAEVCQVYLVCVGVRIRVTEGKFKVKVTVSEGSCDHVAKEVFVKR